MKSYLDSLIKHPFTSIQLSDKEKFHTGMLKIMLDTIGEPAYACVFGNEFTKELYSNNGTPLILLEQGSIDMVIKKSLKNVEKNTIFAIIESKFKTGLHYSKVKGEYRDQLTKYAYSKTGLKAKDGFVISLFKENEEDLKIENIPAQKVPKLKIYKPLQFIGFDFIFLQKEIIRYNELNKDKPGVLDQVALIKMWLNYLKNLSEVVNFFVEKKFKDISNDNFENDLKKIKLKGVFERYRLKLIEKKLLEKINTQEQLKESLKRGASFENIPNAENNFIIIKNTNGNESLLLALNSEEGHKKFYYGIEWQAGSVKVFIKWNLSSLNEINQVSDELKQKREEALIFLIEKLEQNLKHDDILTGVIKKDKAINGKVNKLSHRNSVFKSVTIIKKNVFQDIEDMSKILFNIICVVNDYGVNINKILK